MAGTQYEHSVEVEKIARELIQKYHKHLVEANFAFLMRYSNSWTSKRKTLWGTAEKVSAKTKFLTDTGDEDGIDFIVTINATIWKGLTLDMKKALVDHELCHCARGDDDKAGNPTWYIDGHSVEDFTAVIRRYGLWSEEVKAVIRAIEDSKTQQTEIFADGAGSDNPQQQSSKVVNLSDKRGDINNVKENLGNTTEDDDIDGVDGAGQPGDDPAFVDASGKAAAEEVAAGSTQPF